MSTPERKLRVGVTIAIRSTTQTIWENGIGQNCIFLARLLANSPQVGRSVLINANSEITPSATLMLGETGLDIIPLAEAAQHLDVIIEMGAQLPDDWVARFKKGGGRYAAMRVGNDYVIDIERAMFDRPNGSLSTAKTFDAVWTIPGHQSICTDYFGITTRSPVRIVPHVWSPLLFQKGIDALASDLSYGYKPGRKRWRVCAFEPNINMVKTSLIPMLACEEAYRMQPSFIESFFVCNTFHLKEQDVFRKLALSLDIVNHGVATFEGRFPVYDFMARQGDCVISHQWECAQNYLYYEILYGGYPLVHNSPLLHDHGYYYPDFETEEGGKVLLHAFAHHDLHLDAYRERCRELIRSLGFDHPENIATYTEELMRLYAKP